MATEPVGRSNFARGREVWYGEALRPTRAGEEDGERKALLRHRVEVRVRCALRAVTILMLLHSCFIVGAIPATVLLFLDVLAVEIIDIDRVVAFTCICSYSAYLIRCPSKTMLYLPSGFKPSYDTCSSSKRRLQLVFSMVHTTSLQIEDTPRNRSQMSLAAVAP